MAGRLDARPIDLRGEGAPPHPLVEFWHYFRGNAGAVGGLVVVVLVVLTAIFAAYVAPHVPAAAVPRSPAAAAVLDGGRLDRVPARHRCGRPRHPLAHHLRRALLVDDRPDRGDPVALGRHQPRPRRRLLPRLDRDHDHAPDGHHPGAAEPVARDRDRGDPRARPRQCDDRGRDRLFAALHAPCPRLGDHRALQGLRHGEPGDGCGPAAPDVRNRAAELHGAPDRAGRRSVSRTRSSMRRHSASSGSAPSRRRRSGARCWPMRASSCCAPGGS